METLMQEPASWSRARLFGFRFAFVYLLLYNLPFPLGALPHTDSLLAKYQWLWHMFVPWVGKHVLHLTHEITAFTNGSGDTTYDYVLALSYFVLALLAAAIWPTLDSSRKEHSRLQQWLFLYIRLCLGAALLSYGAAKIFDQQFAPPTLRQLLQPHGDSSLMDLLWLFMGASRGYRLFAGFVEMFAGILLFVPRLSLLGAFLGVAALANVFALNLFYNVPVKLYSLHLLLMSAFLTLPHAGRLAGFLLNRSTVSVSAPGLFQRTRLNTAALALQLLLGLFLAGSDLYQDRAFEKENSIAANRPPFYGIWAVDEFSVGGKVLPPLMTDEFRWQRAVIQYPKGIGIQSMNGEWAGYWLRRDMEKRTFEMETPGEPKRKFQFTFATPDSHTLILSGTDGTSEVHVSLHRLDESKFDLLNHTFEWIHEDSDY